MFPAVQGNIFTQPMSHRAWNGEMTGMSQQGATANGMRSISAIGGSSNIPAQSFYPATGSAPDFRGFRDRGVQSLPMNNSGANNHAPVIKSAEELMAATISMSPAAEPALMLNSKLAVPVYQYMMNQHKGNYTSSSFSLAVPLSLILMGADGITEAEGKQLLSAGNTAITTAASGLADLSRKYAPSELVKIANYIYTDQSFSLSEDYKNHINAAGNYLNERRVEFVFEQKSNLTTEAFKVELNSTVNRDTGGKIPQLLTAPLAAGTKMVLLNTILLKAKWQEKLKIEKDFYFNGETSRSITPAVRFKNALFNSVNVYDNYNTFLRSWQVAWCPFANSDYGVLLAMPKKGKHREAFESALEKDILVAAMAALNDASCQVRDVIFPKMKVASALPFDEILSHAGLISSAVNPLTANFGKLSAQGRPGGGFHITKIFQKVIFELDENGVQASAATCVASNLFCKPIPPIPPILFDHTFRGFVVNKPTCVPLFEVTITEKPEDPNMNW